MLYSNLCVYLSKYSLNNWRNVRFRNEASSNSSAPLHNPGYNFVLNKIMLLAEKILFFPFSCFWQSWWVQMGVILRSSSVPQTITRTNRTNCSRPGRHFCRPKTIAKKLGLSWPYSRSTMIYWTSAICLAVSTWPFTGRYRTDMKSFLDFIQLSLLYKPYSPFERVRVATN